MNLSVETSGTKQCLVKNVGTVGGSHDDDTAICAKTVHLCEQLVQRVFTLIITAHRSSFSTSTSNGINLVDEDDAWGFGLGLLEEVTNTARSHTNKHFHEFRT